MSQATSAPPHVAPDEALAVAQRDAVAVYRNLNLFRIEIMLESDGWHIDYVLRDPNRKGGGPRYVIDPSSGEITWKRYEQ